LDVVLVSNLSGMTVTERDRASSYIKYALAAEEGYTLPESFTIRIEGSDTVYTVYTTAENAALNPTGVSYDTSNNIVTLRVDTFLNNNRDCTLHITGNAVPLEDTTTPPEEESVTPPEEENATPPEEENATPPEEENATPPEEESVTPPEEGTETPPEEG